MGSLGDREWLEPVGSVGSVATAAATTTAAAVATATAAATKITATAAATTAATATTGLGFIDADGATHPLHILEILDGLGFLSGVGHLHESKTAFAACVAVEGEAALAHLPVLTKQVLDIFRFCIEGKIADVNGHELRNYEWILRQPKRKWSAR
ncbi:MAG: hypothetical protein ACI9IO_000031 [Cyanobium sp.]